jgi:hypothetical protein
MAKNYIDNLSEEARMRQLLCGFRLNMIAYSSDCK